MFGGVNANEAEHESSVIYSQYTPHVRQ